MANKVKEYRQELGMTLEKLSVASGVPVSTLFDIEKGADPKVSTAIKIAEALYQSTDKVWNPKHWNSH